MEELAKRLCAYLDTAPVADGHEHYCIFRQFRDAAGGSFVALALLAYLRDDVLALGAQPAHVYPTPTAEQAWSACGPRLWAGGPAAPPTVNGARMGAGT